MQYEVEKTCKSAWLGFDLHMAHLNRKYQEMIEELTWRLKANLFWAS